MLLGVPTLDINPTKIFVHSTGHGLVCWGDEIPRSGIAVRGLQERKLPSVGSLGDFDLQQV